MEIDSYGGVRNDQSHVGNGDVTQDEDCGTSIRRCHSDTSLNEHIENPKDIIIELPYQSNKKKRVRHLSQPSRMGSDPKARQQQPPRPIRRPLINMDGMVYDPINRKFMRKPSGLNDSNNDLSTTTGRQSSSNHAILTHANSLNEIRIKNPQLNRIHRNAVSVVDNPYLNYLDNNYKTVGSETRSIDISMLRSIASSAKEQGSVISLEQYRMPPSTEHEKLKIFKSMLSIVGSSMYAVLIVTVGLILSVFDIFTTAAVAEGYYIFLVAGGLLYFTYLLVDIRLYIHKAKKHYKDKKAHEEAIEAMLFKNEIDSMQDPQQLILQGDKITLDLPEPVKPLEHPYCFTHGRHAGSFYLKFGAACFCLGHLVHSALLLSLQILFLESDTGCGNVVVLVLDIIYPIYSFCQLFFIFKYSNVIIIRNKVLGRIALMHCISSSLCIWMWTILRETMDAIVISSNKKNGDSNIDNQIFDLLRNLIQQDDSTVWKNDSESQVGTYILPSETKNNCSKQVGFDTIFHGLSPYLYPFTVEYSILIVGVFYIMWSNIGNCPKEEFDKAEYHDKSEWISEQQSTTESERCKLPTAVDDNGMTSNLVIYVDLHSANKGIFGGILILVLTIVSIIMSFIMFSDSKLKETGAILISSTSLTLQIVMLIAVLMAYWQIKKLDVNPHPISLLDDILLFICIPAFIMELTFTCIAVLEYEDMFLMANVLVMTIQALIQIPFITDGLRRCSNTRELLRNKPGRELITFLIVCNVATWIFETFSIKNADVNDVRYDFYGKILWSILGHISTPLIMFYRFHSSVCLVDIWKAAYEPGNAH